MQVSVSFCDQSQWTHTIYNGGSCKIKCCYSVHLETGTCGWCHHRAPTGFIPLCTCSYMAYLLDRTFTAPQGADCSGRQTESWDPWCTFPLCSLPPAPSFQSPHTLSPPNHPPTTTIPWAEGLFQLHFKLRSSSSTAVEAPCDLLSNSAVQNTWYTSRVWELLKHCSTYIIKSTFLSCAALPKERSVCF